MGSALTGGGSIPPNAPAEAQTLELLVAVEDVDCLSDLLDLVAVGVGSLSPQSEESPSSPEVALEVEVAPDVVAPAVVDAEAPPDPTLFNVNSRSKGASTQRQSLQK